MSPRVLLAVVCLVAGVMLAAWSLAAGQLLLALVGFALIFVFLFLAMEAMAKAGKPKHPLKKAADPAWSMKDGSSHGDDMKGPQ
jgi:membrane protein implicated in regulation of membrane protease activity